MTLLFLANAWGFIVAHKRFFIIAVGVLLLLIIIFSFRGCGSKTVKIDEDTINRINKGNEKERKAELEKVILENSDVVKTVDERSNIAETNVIERNRLLDEKIKEVDKKIAESKANGKDVTQAELICLLQPENCQ